MNRDQVIDLSLMLRQCPPKPHKLLKFFMISVILLKMGKHTWFSSQLLSNGVEWQDFTVVTKLIKNFKTLYGFGGYFLNIRNISLTGFEPCFKVYNLVSVYPIKASNLVKWLISTRSFNMCWCQLIDWLKFETRPSSLHNFEMVYAVVSPKDLSIHPIC